jgi:cytokinin dehydrogenase
MSTVVPSASDGMMYIFSVLRATDPARCGAVCVDGIMEQHRRLADEAFSDGATPLDGINGIMEQYLARLPSPAHWRDHFGSGWNGSWPARPASIPCTYLGRAREFSRGRIRPAPCDLVRGLLRLRSR